MNNRIAGALLVPFLVSSCGNFHEDGDATKPEIGAPARAMEIAAHQTKLGIDYLNRPETQQSLRDGVSHGTQATVKTAGTVFGGVIDGVEKLTEEQPAAPAQ